MVVTIWAQFHFALYLGGGEGDSVRVTVVLNIMSVCEVNMCMRVCEVNSCTYFRDMESGDSGGDISRVVHMCVCART
jgi:hypothetical protein